MAKWVAILVLAATTVGRFLKEIDETGSDDSAKVIVETIDESTDTAHPNPMDYDSCDIFCEIEIFN